MNDYNRRASLQSSLAAPQVFGANTGVGKTVVTAGLVRAAVPQVGGEHDEIRARSRALHKEKLSVESC